MTPLTCALAKRIAALPPLAVQAAKRTFNAASQQRAAEVYEVGLLNELLSARSEDLLEALAAVQERRPGTFRGR